MKKKSFIKVGARVKWNDPGLDDYDIKDRLDIIGREFEVCEIRGEIILISEVGGGTEAEVFADELEPYINKPHRATLLFGCEAIEMYEEGTSEDEILERGVIDDVEFKTKAELRAYLQGIEDALGWDDAKIVNSTIENEE